MQVSKTRRRSNKTLRNLSRSAAAIVCALAASTTSAQSTSESGNLAFSGGGPACGDVANNSTSTLVVSCSYQNDHGGSAAAFGSTATMGHLGVEVSAIGSSSVSRQNGWPGGTNGGNVSAAASFYDLVMIDSGGRTGIGQLTFSMYLDAQGNGLNTASPIVDANGTSLAGVGDDVRATLNVAGQTFVNQAGYSSNLSVNSQGLSTNSTSAYSLVNGLAAPDILGYYTYTVPFTFGSEFVLGMSLMLSAYASALGNAAASISVDATHSFDWAGIQGVTVDGAPIAFSLTSASGTDWRISMAPPIGSPVLAVPEPATYALVLVGIAALVLQERRRHWSRLAHQTST